MPVAKVNKITNILNNTFKNLRGRKVPFQVPLHTESTNDDILPPTKNGSPNSKFVSLERRRKSSYGKKLPKNINSRLLRTKQSEKRSASLNSLDELFLTSSTVVQKTKNRKSKRKMTKSRPFSTSEYIRPSRSRSVCSLDKFCGSSTIPERTETIRSCRKKNAEILWEGDVFSAESSSSDTNSKLKSKSNIKSEPLYDEWCGPSQDKTKQRNYRETSGAQRLDNVVHTEPTRRPRSLCTLDCCNSLPSTGERFKKQRIHKKQSFDNLSFTPSPMDEKYLKSSLGYLRQEDIFLPTSKVVVEFRKKRIYRKKSGAQRLDNVVHTEPTRRPRSLCTLGCCSSLPATGERFKKQRIHKKNSFDNLSFTPSPMDEKYLKSSLGYLRQEDIFLPTSKVVVEFRKKRIYRKKSGAQRLDNVVHTEPTRRPRSLCTLGCCSSLPATGERFKKQRIHKKNSFDNMSFTPSPMDEKYIKSSLGYLRQEDSFLPTSKVVVEFRKKRIYRKKSISDAISMKPKRKPKISLLTFDDLKVPSATVVVDIFKKKTYRKKISDFPTASSNNNRARSKAIAPDLADDNAMFTPVKTISQNDDISGCVTNLEPSHNDNEINFSQSTVTASQTSDCVSQCQYIKRGRGRPRKISLPVLEACPVVGSGLGTDDELTCTCSSTQSTVPRESQPGRRSRKKRWCWEDEQEEPQEEEVSEYELMRRRNIEENMKMLRQIFMDQGLELEEKSSDSPKMRKNYTRLPLPPPRPKSARIEVKRSSCSLDFSKFCHKHSV